MTSGWTSTHEPIAVENDTRNHVSVNNTVHVTRLSSAKEKFLFNIYVQQRYSKPAQGYHGD